ncbi:hypothetical protein U1Q18_044839 [Sarracenia purpurea var. burkii]
MDGSPTEEDLPQTQLATMVDNFTPGNGTQGQPAATADDLTQEDPPQGQPAATADDLTQEDPPQGQPATTDDDLLCRDLLDYIYNIICVKVVEALQHSDDHRVALVLWSDHRPYSAARIEIIQAVNRGLLRLLASATTHIPGLEFQIGPAHFETEFATAIEKVERIIAGWPDVAFTESSPISKVPVQDLLLKNGSASVVVRSGSAIALLVLFMVTGWISVWERTSKLYYPPGAVLASPHDIIDPNSRQLRGVNDCSASNAALALVSATRGMLPANVN